MTKKKLSVNKPKASLKIKRAKTVRKTKAAQHPLSNEKLEVLGAKYRPAPSWYDEDELT